MKLLVFPTGCGEQMIHLDDQRGLMPDYKQTFSWLGYCTDGKNSTALPNFKCSEVATEDDKEGMQRAHPLIFNKANYTYARVNAGDHALFRSNTFHFAKLNDTPGTRYALFLMIDGQCARGRWWREGEEGGRQRAA